MVNVDRAILSATFLSRLSLVRISEDHAAAEAREEWREAHAWLASDKDGVGSFRWYCTELGLDPGAVRRALEDVK